MTPGFTTKNGELYCEERPVRPLVQDHDTPLYIYSQNHFLDRLNQFEEALGGLDHTICYAMKCNGNLSILRRMAEAGSGFDIVSGGELKRALKAGADPSDIVYAGVAKTRSEQRAALEAGIAMFNLESMAEMEQLNEVAGDVGTRATVAFRVNPDVDAKTHEKISTGKKENKFGLPIGRIDEYVERTEGAEHLDLRGLHFHIGSQITSVDPFREVVSKAVDLVDELRDRGVDITTLNMGGGIGIRYRNESTITPAQWAEVVAPEVQERDLHLIVEPGRFIMGNAGVLATNVVYVKKSVTKNFVIVDAGMNDLIRPAMYGSYHEIVPVQPRSTGEIEADVVGPICETGDYLGKDRTLPEPEPGDTLAVKSAGAYGFAMSSQYNAFPRPAEILVDGDEATVIREAESYDDLWQGELMPEPAV